MGKRTERLLTILPLVHLLLFFVGYGVMAFLKVTPGGTVHKWFVILWMLIAMAWLIAIVYMSNRANDKVKPDVFYLGDLSYDTWKEKFDSTIKAYGYQIIHSAPEEPYYSFSMYIQAQSRDPLSCIIIVRTHELRDSIVDNVNNAITDLLKRYLDCKTIRTSVDVISVFCVDKVSPAFYGLVNCHMEQGLKNGRLVVGISFGGKRLYLGNFGDGFGKMKYQKLRKQFVVMAGLEGEEPLKVNK